jgi:DNA-binding CsgD family transcriptional regulator/uncharacterized protein YciI
LINREFRDDERLRTITPAHRSYWRRMADKGVLLGGGAWTEGCGEALVVSTSGGPALQYLLGADPYAQERLVIATRIRQLEDVLGSEAAPGPGPDPEAQRKPDPPDRGGLSAHEHRVARMMLEGLTNRQIAERFVVSPRAVEQHITRIYRKLSISRRAQLALALSGSAPMTGA